jgi:hypothetical protein
VVGVVELGFALVLEAVLLEAVLLWAVLLWALAPLISELGVVELAGIEPEALVELAGIELEALVLGVVLLCELAAVESVLLGVVLVA